MLKKKYFLRFSLFLCVSAPLLFSPAFAQTPASDLQNQAVDYVVLPSPLEMVIVLASFGGKVPLPEPTEVKSEDVAKVAMAGGIAVADVIAAIKEKDKEKTLGFSQVLLNYAKKLKVDPLLLNNYGTFTSLVNQGDWASATRLVNEMAVYINFALERGRFSMESRLANVAGWIEGLRLSCLVLQADYDSAKAAQLLQYEHLLSMLDKQLSALPANVRDKAEYKVARETIQEISKTVSNKNALTQENVEHLVKLTTNFRDTIHN